MPTDDENGSEMKEPETSAGKTPEEAAAANAEERVSRFDNAKAFFRALNAGGEVAPDEFGMKVPGSGESGRSVACPTCSMLEGQRAEAEAKATEVENLYKRMAADFENYRKRTDRERDEFKDMGVQQGILEILPALDDLDRAQLHLDENSDPRELKETLVLLYNRFLKCFELLGVKPIDVVKQPFDPRLHEPVQQIETDEIPEGHVVHELRRGYSFRDKVIRPALVNVAMPKMEKPAHPVMEAVRTRSKEKHSEAEAEGEQNTNLEPDGKNFHKLSDEKLSDEQVSEDGELAPEIGKIEALPKEDEPASESFV